MVIDLAKCVGCQTCTIACKQEHALPPEVFWRYVVDCEVGEYPNVRRLFLPMQCMHCGDPPCVPVCPTGASQRRADGIVWVEYDKCVGCGYCAVACPYRARHLIHEQTWYFPAGPTPAELETADPKRRGVMTKCTFCRERLDSGGQPACALSCIANAIHFGDLDDPESLVSRLIKDRGGVRLMPELGTDPSVYYLSEPWRSS
jgi:phenylacetyl-CoA:acceptor oxidoreductase subunit 1